MVPWFMVMSLISFEFEFARPSCSHRRRAADNLGEFLGDRRLARLVVDELQLLDDLAGVVGRRPSSRPSAPTARRPCSRSPSGRRSPRGSGASCRRAASARRARRCSPRRYPPASALRTSPGGQRPVLLGIGTILPCRGSCFIVLMKVVKYTYTSSTLAGHVLVDQRLHRADHLVEVRPVAQLHDARHDVARPSAAGSPGPGCRCAT